MLAVPSKQNGFELLLSAPPQGRRFVVEGLAVFFSRLQDALEARLVWISPVVARAWRSLARDTSAAAVEDAGHSRRAEEGEAARPLVDLAFFRAPRRAPVAALAKRGCFVETPSAPEVEALRLSGLHTRALGEEQHDAHEERAPLLAMSVGPKETSETALWLALSPGEGLSCRTLRAVGELLAEQPGEAGGAGAVLAVSARVFGEPASPWLLPAPGGDALPSPLHCARVASGGLKALGVAVRLARGCRCCCSDSAESGGCPHEEVAARRLKKILDALDSSRKAPAAAFPPVS